MKIKISSNIKNKGKFPPNLTCVHFKTCHPLLIFTETKTKWRTSETPAGGRINWWRAAAAFTVITKYWSWDTIRITRLIWLDESLCICHWMCCGFHWIKQTLSKHIKPSFFNLFITTDWASGKCSPTSKKTQMWCKIHVIEFK